MIPLNARVTGAAEEGARSRRIAELCPVMREVLELERLEGMTILPRFPGQVGSPEGDIMDLNDELMGRGMEANYWTKRGYEDASVVPEDISARQADGHNTAGYVYAVRGEGEVPNGTIDHRSYTSLNASDSSGGAELNALTLAVKVGLGHRMLLLELGQLQPRPTIIYVDAQVVIAGVAAGRITRGMKYLAARYQMVRQAQEAGVIVLLTLSAATTHYIGTSLHSQCSHDKIIRSDLNDERAELKMRGGGDYLYLNRVEMPPDALTDFIPDALTDFNDRHKDLRALNTAVASIEDLRALNAGVPSTAEDLGAVDVAAPSIDFRTLDAEATRDIVEQGARRGKIRGARGRSPWTDPWGARHSVE